MTFDEYSKKAREFNVVPEDRQESHALCGLVEEVGELLGKYKRALRGDTPLDNPALEKELGDILWYLNDISVILGLSLNSVAESNIQKLEDRRTRNVISGEGDER